MRTAQVDEHLYDFWRPFYQLKTGQILALCGKQGDVRDTAAVVQISRHFPLPDYENIRFKPSGGILTPSENIITIGLVQLFFNKDMKWSDGKSPNWIVSEQLKTRLIDIVSRCCFHISSKDRRSLVNSVTKRRYTYEPPAPGGRQVDFGVIRRMYAGAGENTVMVEGIRWLGTLGAAKAATTPALIKAVRSALAKLEGYDESRPLEILVQTSFEPTNGTRPYTANDVSAGVIGMAYDRQWAYDFTGSSEWIDQLPWDFAFEVTGDKPPVDLGKDLRDLPVPRLEIEAEPTRQDVSDPALCKLLFSSIAAKGKSENRPGAAAVRKCLEELTLCSDRVRMTVVTRLGGPERRHRVPVTPSPPRLSRKRYLWHLVLCRLVGRSMKRDEATIRRILPQFGSPEDKKDLVGQFTSSINGKLRDGFKPLLGTKARPKHFICTRLDRKAGAYELYLEDAALVVKLRLPETRERRRPRPAGRR